MLFSLLAFPRSLKPLQPKQNFLNHLVTILWSFVPWLFFVALYGIMAQFKLIKYRLYVHLCVFKSYTHTEWSNAQHVSTPTTRILSTTIDIFYGLNCFSHMIYAPWHFFVYFFVFLFITFVIWKCIKLTS